MLAVTPVTQHCYSAVSSSLTNPLPIICHFATPTTSFLVSLGQTLYQATPLETNTSLLQCFTAENSLELRRNAVPRGSWTTSILFKLLTQFTFVYFLSISSSLCSLSQSPLCSLPTIPSFFSDQFFVLLR